MGFLRRGSAALAVFASMCALAAAPASAWHARNIGQPGKVQVLRIYGFQAEARQMPSCVFCDEMDSYFQDNAPPSSFAAYTPERYIWRAPYSGAQDVTVQYRLYHKNYCSDYGLANGTCNDGFKFFKQDVYHFTIPADSTSIRTVGWADYVDANYPDGVTFGMDIVFSWHSANGALLGQTYLDYNSTGDYACLTRLCGVGYTPKYGAWIYVHS
jgi:hypothetical protein